MNGRSKENERKGRRRKGKEENGKVFLFFGSLDFLPDYRNRLHFFKAFFFFIVIY